jgi:intergrase/recombinase
MTTTENPIKKEYLQLLRKMKKQFKATEDCKEKEQFILAIDTYIKTIKSDEISDNDLIEYLKREMKKNETI